MRWKRRRLDEKSVITREAGTSTQKDLRDFIKLLRSRGNQLAVIEAQWTPCWND